MPVFGLHEWFSKLTTLQNIAKAYFLFSNWPGTEAEIEWLFEYVANIKWKIRLVKKTSGDLLSSWKCCFKSEKFGVKLFWKKQREYVRGSSEVLLGPDNYIEFLKHFMKAFFS